MINSRLETAAEKPMFASSFSGHHCLVLADGYYEWRTVGKHKQPYRITLKTGEPFAMPGQVENAALKPLPAEAYGFAYWKQCRAGLDYHVEIDKHYYSVPYTLMCQELWARYTTSTVEVSHRGKRVAVHRRGPPNRGHTTLPEHMPSSHRGGERALAGSFHPLARKASYKLHDATAGAVALLGVSLLAQDDFDECGGVRPDLAGLSLDALECPVGIAPGTRSFRSVKSILDTKLDRKRPEKE
jgi:hypothetical protein